VNVIIALKTKYITSSKKIRFKFTFSTAFIILKPSKNKLKKAPKSIANKKIVICEVTIVPIFLPLT